MNGRENISSIVWTMCEEEWVTTCATVGQWIYCWEEHHGLEDDSCSGQPSKITAIRHHTNTHIKLGALTTYEYFLQTRVPGHHTLLLIITLEAGGGSTHTHNTHTHTPHTTHAHACKNSLQSQQYQHHDHHGCQHKLHFNHCRHP